MQTFQIGFERFVCCGRLHRVIQIGRRRRRQNLRRRRRQLFRLIQTIVPIFIDQPLHHRQLVIKPGLTHRRRLMPDQASGAPTLGLRSLANNRDQIGVNIRQVAQRQLGITFAGQRRRLARQPFQRTMRADVQHHIRAELFPQPFVIGQIMMGRRAIGRMVDLSRILAETARRLDANDHVSQPHSRDQQAPILHKHLTRRFSPIPSQFPGRFFR